MAGMQITRLMEGAAGELTNERGEEKMSLLNILREIVFFLVLLLVSEPLFLKVFCLMEEADHMDI